MRTEANGSTMTLADAPIKIPVLNKRRNYVYDAVDEMIDHNFFTIDSYRQSRDNCR
jgi:hypothetical protein